MFSSPLNSNSDTTGSDCSPPGQTIYSYQCHSRIRKSQYRNNDEVNNNNLVDSNGRALRPAPIEFKPPPSNQQLSPFLHGVPLNGERLDFLQPLAPTTSSTFVSKKEAVSYIRIWTELYDVFSKIDKINGVVVLDPFNTKFFQRLIVTNTIHITYCENYPLISNMLQLLNWTPECRFWLSARGFCEDFMTFLKTLPRINAVCLRDVCSNESIEFGELLKILTNVDELEIDMRHIKFNEDPGIMLMQWKRPATLKRFVLHNLVLGISAVAVQHFCQEKVVPGGLISVTYEKYPKQG